MEKDLTKGNITQTLLFFCSSDDPRKSIATIL